MALFKAPNSRANFLFKLMHMIDRKVKCMFGFYKIDIICHNRKKESVKT